MRNTILVLTVAGAVLLSSGCRQLQSRNQLNQGVEAFKIAQYPEAAEHFKRAVDLQPDFLEARLYLGTAYMLQYEYGAAMEGPESERTAQAAHDEFTKVLEQTPKEKVAIASIASLYLIQQQWRDAQEWYEKLVAVDPNNAEGYYCLGFIAWSRWFPRLGKARADLGMRQEDPGPIKDRNVREALKAKYLPMVDAGLAALDKALAINPEYDDAMAYENVLIRGKADLSDNKEEYDKLIKTADTWFQKSIRTRKERDERKGRGTGGITEDSPK